MKKYESRKLSDNELSYLYFEELASPYFEVFLEYSSNNIELIRKKFNDAIVKTMKKYIELNNVIDNKKFIYKKIKIEIHSIDCEFDGYNFDSVFSRFSDELPIQLYNINNKFLAFRFNHAYIDGKGSLVFIDTFLSYLSNIIDNTQTNSYISDLDFIEGLPFVKHSRNISFNNKLSYKSLSKKNKVFYKRLTINKQIPFVLSKIITVMNSYYDNDKLTYLLPTNIRNLKPEIISVSNLTEILYLKCNKNDDWLTISKNIHNKLSKYDNLNVKNINYGILLKIKPFLYKLLVKLSVMIECTTNRFLTAGNLTSLIFYYDKYNTNQFKIESVFMLPFYQPLLPYAIAIIESKNKIDIIFCSNIRFIEEETADKIMNDIKNIVE